MRARGDARLAMRARAILLACIGLTGCRFGGPSADPDAYVAFPSDAETDDASDSSVSPGDDATVVSMNDATVGDDSAGGDATSLGDSPSEGEGGTGGEGGCTATVAVCDPVHNTGCPNTLQQCDVDPTQMTTPTGVCVFNSGSDAGGACTTSVFTESCAPKSTCVSGACRALCFCDTDCPPGNCCTDTTGPTGFTLCAACH